MAKKQSKVESELQSQKFEEELNTHSVRKKKQKKWYICYESSNKPNCWCMIHSQGPTDVEAWARTLVKLQKENSLFVYTLHYAKCVDDE